MRDGDWEPVEQAPKAPKAFQSDGEKLSRAPYAAWVTVVALVAWQVYVAGLDGNADGATLIQYGARKPSFGFPQAPWRLLASMFLHGGWLHLVSNGLLIVLWGSQICRLLGTRAFLALFILTGLWGSLMGDIYGPEALAIGSSGGSSGLVTALLALSLFAPHLKRWSGTQKSWLQSSAAVLVLNGTLALGITSSMPVRLDHWAHLGGAGMGLLLGLGATRDGDHNSRYFWVSCLVSAALLVAIVYQRGFSPFG